jgi:hypothetical protein
MLVLPLCQRLLDRPSKERLLNCKQTVSLYTILSHLEMPTHIATPNSGCVAKAKAMATAEAHRFGKLLATTQEGRQLRRTFRSAFRLVHCLHDE